VITASTRAKARVDLEKVREEAVREALSKARVVVLGVARYMRPCFALPIVLTEHVETAAADERGRLLFNPFFVAALSEEELMGVMAHEILHVIMKHPGGRMGGLVQELYEALRLELEGAEGLDLGALAREARALANIGFDAEVNPLVLDMGFGLPRNKEVEVYYKGERIRSYPLDPVLPEGFCSEKGKLGEEYAWELVDLALGRKRCGEGRPQADPRKTSPSGGQGAREALERLKELLERLSPVDDVSGEGSGREDPEQERARREALRQLLKELDEQGIGMSPEELEILRDEVARRVQEHVRSRGTVPAGLERWAEERLRPKVNWRALLRRAIRKGYLDLREKVYPTFARPDRRSHAYHPVLVPGGYTITPRVAVVVDTSGSVSDGMLGQALAEVRGIVRGMGPVDLYSVDAAVHAVRKVFGNQPVQLYGGGGTDMGVGIARAVEDGHQLVVVLTDGLTPWPPHPPKRGVKVVAGILGDGPNPPGWIRAVRIEE